MVIISGGQTGVDRAAWDVALELGLKQDGWVPAGRKAEDGVISEEYNCRETSSSDYSVRTEQNILEAEATLVIGFGKPQGGTLLTLGLCRKHKRPVVFLDLEQSDEDEQLNTVKKFLLELCPKKLNVAGPRGSFRPDVYTRAKLFLIKALSAIGHS